MMDDIAEQQDVAREISDAISNPVAFGQDVDEDELEKELEELEQEELDKELLGIESTDELPAVPAAALPAVPAKAKTSIDALSIFRCRHFAIFLMPLTLLLFAFPEAKPAEEDDDLKELEAWAS